MKNKDTINIDNLLALCHILDNYKEFEQRLSLILANEKNKDFAIKLWDFSKNKENRFLIGKKVKKFYKENKEIIDTINKYSSISRFINNNFDNKGNPTKNIEFFANYLLENKKHINQIITLLKELKKLDFYEFTFDENLNFEKETYVISPTFTENTNITYVANPTVIPTYTNKIQYKSNNSNYKIELKVITYSSTFDRKKLTLNSLLFDVNTLPKEINKENIFDPLLEAKKEQFNATKLIKKSVNLNVSIDDLEKQVFIIIDTIDKIDNISSKQELLNVLTNIQTEIKILKIMGTSYNKEIIEEEELLTDEILENEKILYLKKRELTKKDWY